MGRFDNAGLVLGPVKDRAAALCRFAGYPGAADSPTALALVASAVEFAEQLASVGEVAELTELWQLGHVWGRPAYDDVTYPELSEPTQAVARQLHALLEHLAPDQLQEVGVALSVAHDMVSLALGFVEEAAQAREFDALSLEDFALEEQLEEERIEEQVDRLLLDAPADWTEQLRGAVVLALVWDVADLVAQIAHLSTLDALPAPLLWQHPGGEHACTSARVPNTDRLVWARIEPEEYEGRPLWSQARLQERWHWSVGWTGSEGQRLWFRGGRTASVAAARWNAERTVQGLLARRHDATSPQNGERLIPLG
ncbi:hypothetical protein [Streptacidiphilus anmyonensis]|uniref:hypothetical protein n=1 Tax=Streptacidiphilus anmyonensis TaxID=405782 RepID=UPI0005AA025B|nr:hypothetical protein [Streptacidiphilus anmyonensis]